MERKFREDTLEVETDVGITMRVLYEYRHWVDPNYGADRDGNRGEMRFGVDVEVIEVTVGHAQSKVELTTDEIEAIKDLLAEKLLDSDQIESEGPDPDAAYEFRRMDD